MVVKKTEFLSVSLFLLLVVHSNNNNNNIENAGNINNERK